MSESTPEANRSIQWPQQVKSIFKWFALLVAMASLLYVSTYLVLVKRREFVRTSKVLPKVMVPGQSMSYKPGKLKTVTLHQVYYDTPLPSIFSGLFVPLLSLDSTKLRTNHWRSYAIWNKHGHDQTYYFDKPFQRLDSRLFPLLTNQNGETMIFEPGLIRLLAAPDHPDKSSGDPAADATPQR